MVHEFVVSWLTYYEIEGREYSRRYARYFSDRDKALAFARKKNQNPMTDWVRIREQESEDYTTPDGYPGVRVHVLAYLSVND